MKLKALKGMAFLVKSKAWHNERPISKRSPEDGVNTNELKTAAHHLSYTITELFLNETGRDRSFRKTVCMMVKECVTDSRIHCSPL